MPKKLASMALKKDEVHTLSSRCLYPHAQHKAFMSQSIMKETGKKRRRKDGSKESVSKPACVIDYNRGMGGVHKQDQQLACFPVMRKFMKQYKKIFF
ncbi:hypothetical protein J437_LFUL010535 [Ladona fulva]|uniref:PiggyBac transposable element-derived protein domain-containing protein n=1 Tax=Ladona fulva TaxID=123851 RepID=A0A8K0P9D2_LADFU|nr:hypothetical protein J437_LFUL010535 [Ladona fulva]